MKAEFIILKKMNLWLLLFLKISVVVSRFYKLRYEVMLLSSVKVISPCWDRRCPLLFSQEGRGSGPEPATVLSCPSASDQPMCTHISVFLKFMLVFNI